MNKNKKSSPMTTMALSCRKNSSTLLRGITSKNNDDFYCLNFLHSFKTNNKNICKNKDFCNVIILSEDTKILDINL